MIILGRTHDPAAISDVRRVFFPLIYVLPCVAIILESETVFVTSSSRILGLSKDEVPPITCARGGDISRNLSCILFKSGKSRTSSLGRQPAGQIPLLITISSPGIPCLLQTLTSAILSPRQNWPRPFQFLVLLPPMLRLTPPPLPRANGGRLSTTS